MMEFQQEESSQASFVNDTVENVSCGFVLHRLIKGFKKKQRWGVLRIERTDTSAKCLIKLYKSQNLNINKSLSKSPQLKLEIEFSRDEFCGIEKGEHYDRYGMRRYLCVITVDQYIILEDAVVTINGINHNVIGSWYQIITESMQYVNKWKIIDENEEKYLHLSSKKLSECLSLERRNKSSNKSLCLRQWVLSTIKEVTETVDPQNSLSISLQFVVESNTETKSIQIKVYGTSSIKTILERMNRPKKHPTNSFLAEIDDLNYSPNLVKVSKPNLNSSSYLSKDDFKLGKNLKDNSSHKIPSENLYVDLKSKKSKNERFKKDSFTSDDTKSKSKKSSTSHQNSSSDEDESLKGPGLATQSCYDSDYQTGESFSTINSQREVMTSHNSIFPPNINSQTTSPNIPPKNQSLPISSAHCSKTKTQNPPPIPTRDPDLNRAKDLICQSLANGIILEDQDQHFPVYENSPSFELSIEEVLRENQMDSSVRWFDLPYSVMVEITIELEKDGVTLSSWKELAEKIGLTFRDVQQLVCLMRSKPWVRPLHVVLFHWHRLQSPIPFTKQNFKKLLQEIGREDLANLISD